MKGKVLFVAGLAVGYVLGTRAGRQRYEQIKGAWLKVWETPALQTQVHKAQDYAAHKVGEAPAVLADGASKLFSSIANSRREAAAKAAPTTTPAPTTTVPASKPASRAKPRSGTASTPSPDQ
jgi:hypothetical protein